MGYCMEQRDSFFVIKKEKQEEAYDYVFDILIENLPKYGYSFVDDTELNSAKTLVDIFQSFSWRPTINKNGDIGNIYFEGEKAGDESWLFCTVAPFVEDGSYIEMMGENGDLWRWIFKDGECNEVSPTIKWE